MPSALKGLEVERACNSLPTPTNNVHCANHEEFVSRLTIQRRSGPLQCLLRKALP